MTYPGWICETCGRGQRFRDNVWNCPGCGKEGCDDCFERYGHCKACCVGKTEHELFVQAIKAGFVFSATVFTVPRDCEEKGIKYFLIAVDENGEVELDDFYSQEECDCEVQALNNDPEELESCIHQARTKTGFWDPELLKRYGKS